MRISPRQDIFICQQAVAEIEYGEHLETGRTEHQLDSCMLEHFVFCFDS